MREERQKERDRKKRESVKLKKGKRERWNNFQLHISYLRVREKEGSAYHICSRRRSKEKVSAKRGEEYSPSSSLSSER